MRAKIIISLSGIILLTVLSAVSVLCQSNINEEQGLKPYDSLTGNDIDSVSVTNGGLVLHIPLASFPQRGALDLMTSATDENGNPFSYQYDTVRLLVMQANHPDQGSTKYFYPIRRQLSASDRLIARTTTIISCISTGSDARFKRSKLRRRVLYWLIQPTTQRVM